MRGAHTAAAKCLKVKVKCVTEVKCERTMSCQAFSVARLEYVRRRRAALGLAGGGPDVSVRAADGVAVAAAGGHSDLPEH